MADMFQPILNQSQFQANSRGMVNQLKGSTNNLGVIEALGKATLIGGQQYVDHLAKEEQANVRAQLGAALDPIIQEGLLGSKSYQEEQRTELATLGETLNRLPLQEAEDADSVNLAVSRIESEMNRKLQFLTKAKEQGRMSPFTFEQEIRRIGRHFVANNPALRKEIMDTIKDTLYDQGIIERLSFDEKIAEDERKLYEASVKDIESELRSRNFPSQHFYKNGVFDLKAAGKTIDTLRSRQLAIDMFKDEAQINKLNDEQKEILLNDSSVVQDVVLGEYYNNLGALDQVFAANPNDFAKAKKEAATYLATAKMNFRANPIIGPNAHRQTVKDALANHEKQTEALLSALESFNSLEDYQKFTSNVRQILSNEQNSNLMTRYNVPEMELLIRFGSIGNLINTTEGQTVVSKLIAQGKEMFATNRVTDPTFFNKVPGTNDTGMNLLLRNSATGVSQGSQELFSKALSAYVSAVDDPELNGTTVPDLKKADQLIQELGKPEYESAFIDINPEAMGRAIELFDSYIRKTDLALKEYINDPKNNNKTIKLEINPSTGMLYAIGGDSQFNNTFVARINNSLKAYANMIVSTPKEAAKSFYDVYFPELKQGVGGVNSSSNNPLNLKGVDGAFRKFNSIEEGIQATENQLMRYYNGLGVANGIKRQSIKDIIDLWRPASDFRGGKDIKQEDYHRQVLEIYNAIVPGTTNKVASVTEKLNLRDKEVMAGLISAMAKIESGKKLDVFRVSSYLKQAGQPQGEVRGKIRKASE